MDTPGGSYFSECGSSELSCEYNKTQEVLSVVFKNTRNFSKLTSFRYVKIKNLDCFISLLVSSGVQVITCSFSAFPCAIFADLLMSSGGMCSADVSLVQCTLFGRFLCLYSGLCVLIPERCCGTGLH